MQAILSVPMSTRLFTTRSHERFFVSRETMKTDCDWTTALTIALGAVVAGAVVCAYIAIAGSPCAR